MIYFNFQDLKQKELYKKAKYIKYVDMDGNEVTEVKAIKIAPIILVDSRDDGGVVVTLRIYNTMPEGLKVLKDATTNPVGFNWICNGKSAFSKERETALLKLSDAPKGGTGSV